MNKTHFGAIHYYMHLDMKLNFTISRIFQEMSLTDFETLHQLCELEKNTNYTITCTSSTQNTLWRTFIIRY